MPRIYVNNDFDVINLPVSGDKDGMKQIFIAHQLLSVYPLLNMDASDDIEDDIFLMLRIDYDLYADKEMKVYRVESNTTNFIPFHLIPFNCTKCNSQVQMLDDLMICEKCEELVIK